LTARGRKLIQEAQRVFVSSASIWECCIKIGLGRLDVDPAAPVAGIEASGFEPLRSRPNMRWGRAICRTSTRTLSTVCWLRRR
jgi:hypothetical protein